MTKVIDIDLYLIRELQASILVNTEEEITGVFLPKSLIEYEAKGGGDAEEGTVIEVTLPEWMAIKKELI